MKHTFLHCLLLLALFLLGTACQNKERMLTEFPKVSNTESQNAFPLVSGQQTAKFFVDQNDFKVVDIAATMLADDVERVTGLRPEVLPQTDIQQISGQPSVVAGTVGKSVFIDQLIREGVIQAEELSGKWEACLVLSTRHPQTQTPLLVIAGSDRRGTAFGLTTLSRSIGVSPWYWWADVIPSHQEALFVENGLYLQDEPSVLYRGIFINDERFGGWAQWVEKTFDTETGQVGPKVYEKVFELLLRLRGNYLWPAMHNGSRAFNCNPQNALLADDYAIVMGSSHCEQMLRNNEDEWKNVGTYGDFNYITNRQTMIDYWEERVKTNGQFENIYTIGLRGIHDYPMEGAATTEQRCALMQKAIDDQRDILRRNINKPVEEVPQLLCTYEEVLDAYHSGLNVPDDVTLLWSDDKHGYTRNLCNPEEMKRKGGAGIYYHLSYHGDPASWIWLSPLSPAFISTELTKAYTHGARKVWIFNVGDIKPAEKEISFAMDLAWDVEKWNPEQAHTYTEQWAEETFGTAFAKPIADMQQVYYQLMAAGKDSHVWFLEYTNEQINKRLQEYRQLSEQAEQLEKQIPEALRTAYFELVLYPIHGAQLINEYQLLSRQSMAEATQGNGPLALQQADRAKQMFQELNDWTYRYNEQLLDGKWKHFFNWRPYHWYYTTDMDAEVCTPELLEEIQHAPKPLFIDVQQCLQDTGATILSDIEGDIPLWIKALTPIQNFSKAREDNIYCRVNNGIQSFEAAATPINNVWHSPYVGPMWSRVGTLHLKKGENRVTLTEVKPDARIEQVFLGWYPPFPQEPLSVLPAASFNKKQDNKEGNIKTINQLGFSNGVLVMPFDTSSYDDVKQAPYVEYEIEVPAGNCRIEVRTLPTLRVYEGREARYAAQWDNQEPQVYSIHTDDFSAEWRWNVLRGYSFRSFPVQNKQVGKHTLRISFLDPGIVLQQILVQAE